MTEGYCGDQNKERRYHNGWMGREEGEGTAGRKAVAVGRSVIVAMGLGNEWSGREETGGREEVEQIEEQGNTEKKRRGRRA